MNDEKLIYDVGAHRGEDTDFYLRKGFSVVAVEAVAEFCADLADRFRDHIDDGKLTVLNVVISSTDTGAVDFYQDENNSAWGTTNLAWVERNRSIGGGRTKKTRKRSTTLANLMLKYGVPRYCKIDIEGNDTAALESIKGAGIPEFVSIESEKRDWNKLVDEFILLRDLGYRKYKIVDQSLVELQTCPHPACEGNDVAHLFQPGSSGLFGNELPGTWLDMPEAIEVYKNIFRGYALNGDDGFFRGSRTIFNLLGHVDKGIGRLRGRRHHVNPARILPAAGWYDTHAAR